MELAKLHTVVCNGGGGLPIISQGGVSLGRGVGRVGVEATLPNLPPIVYNAVLYIVLNFILPNDLHIQFDVPYTLDIFAMFVLFLDRLNILGYYAIVQRPLHIGEVVCGILRRRGCGFLSLHVNHAQCTWVCFELWDLSRLS